MRKIQDSSQSRPWRMVHVCSYKESPDLSKINLMSKVGCSKEEVATVMGKLADRSEMQMEEIPGEELRHNGEEADEIHEWPNATQGPCYHPTMLFRENRMILLKWKMRLTGTTKKSDKPWWKLW